MVHLDEDQLVDLAADAAGDEVWRHVADCEKCSERLSQWRTFREHLAPVIREHLSDSEAHQLRTMFRSLGPASRPSFVEHVATLVRSSLGSVAPGLRGAGAAELMEFEAGPFSIMVEVTNSADAGFVVHGQVLNADVGDFCPGRIVFDSGIGPTAVEPLSEFGEFHVRVPTSGVYSVAVLIPGGRVQVDRLRIGIDEDD